MPGYNRPKLLSRRDPRLYCRPPPGSFLRLPGSQTTLTASAQEGVPLRPRLTRREIPPPGEWALLDRALEHPPRLGPWQVGWPAALPTSFFPCTRVFAPEPQVSWETT